MTVQCGWLKQSVLSTPHVVLEPNDEATWPAGLVFREQLIQLPSEDNAKVEVIVENMTDNNIVLGIHTTLGWLHSVDAIYPSQKNATESQTPQFPAHSVPLAAPPSRTAKAEPRDQPADLSHLTSGQQQQVKQMLREECGVFVKNDWDTGSFKYLEFDIKLKDKVPV